MSMAVALVAAILAAYVLRNILAARGRHKALKLPPGPRGWPVVGSLGALAGELPPHRALAALAARHGPLMHLRLGSYHTVMASSADTARFVLKTHDHAFADRPRTAAGEVASYGYLGIVHTPYGAYWRMARKLCATELFSARRVESFERVREQEMRALARGLFESAGRAVDVREHVAGATLRNILRMAVGEKWSGCYGSPEGEAFRRTLDEAFAVTGAVSNVGEWIPWLGWLDLQGCVRRMRRLREQYDRFFEQILDEHEKRRRGQGAGASCEFVASDLVDVLLQRAEEDKAASEARLVRHKRAIGASVVRAMGARVCGHHGRDVSAIGAVGVGAPACVYAGLLARACVQRGKHGGCARSVRSLGVGRVRVHGRVTRARVAAHGERRTGSSRSPGQARIGCDRAWVVRVVV